MEIIVSNDCSSDATWDLIQNEYDNYHGDHEIIIRKNERNLGINQHFNVLMSQASGEYIVIAAAADVMSFDRVERSVQFLRKSKSVGMHSNASIIDAKGEEIRKQMRPDDFSSPGSWEEMLQQGASRVAGATMAWHRSVIDVFGTIPEAPLGEDAFIPFRCSLLGGMGYLNASLVSYRSHSENVSFWKALETGDRGEVGRAHFSHRLRVLECWKQDIGVAFEKGYIDQESCEKSLLMCTEQTLRLGYLEKSMGMSLFKATRFLNVTYSNYSSLSLSFFQTLEEYLLFKYFKLYRVLHIKSFLRRRFRKFTDVIGCKSNTGGVR